MELPPDPISESLLPPNERDPHSSFKLKISLSIGYERKRAVLAGKWEGPIVSIVLAIGSVVVVLLFIYFLASLRQ